MGGHLHDERPLDRVERRLKARDDHGLIPASVAVPLQLLIDELLGDDVFDIERAAPFLERLADVSSEGHDRSLRPWTANRVRVRVRELVESYQLPPELGGDLVEAVG